MRPAFLPSGDFSSWPTSDPVAIASGSGKDGRFAETEIQGVVRAYADAVHALHAARVDDHSVLFYFCVNEYVRRADSRAVAAMVAGVGHAYLAGCDFVGEAEKPAVRTRVSAEPLLPKEIHRHEPADE